MNRASSIFSLLLILCLSLQPNLSLCAVDSHFEACRNPITCGHQSISFPFYIDHQQDPSCGYPGFAVTCQKDRPILNLSNTDYVIHDIVYSTQSLRVSNAAVSDPTALCHVTSPTTSIKNLTLNPVLFKLYENVTSLFLLYNCRNLTRNLVRYKINCSTADAADAAVLGVSDSGVVDAFKKCRSVVEVPVEESVNGSRREIGDGFAMTWTATNCSRCEESGGRCGFDRQNFHFMCFCPEQPHYCCCNGPNFSIGLYLGLSSGIVGILILGVTLFCLRRRWRPLFSNGNLQSNQVIKDFIKRQGITLTPKRFAYSEVKRMTCAFKEKVGQGGFGAVYKGKLHDGTVIAVKLLNSSKGSNGEEFINEVASISRTSHVNIVNLLGFCFEGSKRALIYEFMPNGSLDRFIRNDGTTDERLGWDKLYQIAVGIARGLEYLHRGCNTRILHFDIKPHNILLDNDLCPKISDFGLSKLCLNRESIVSMMVARGTIGYIAPEVFSGNFGGVSHKSDVYSYGMMLMEMVGGRKKFDMGGDRSSEMYFPDRVYRLLELHHDDLGLPGQRTTKENEIARKMTLVGLWCIQTDPSQRPPISGVIEMLEGSIESLQIPPKTQTFSPIISMIDSFPSLESSI